MVQLLKLIPQSHRFFHRLLSSIVCILFLVNCAPGVYPAGDFYAIVISDTHVNNDEAKINRLNWLIEEINFKKIPDVELVFVTGDVVSSVFRNYPDTTDNRLRRAVSAFSKLNIPYFLAMGNHDYKIRSNRDSDVYFPEAELRQMEKIWKKYTGMDSYYSYQHKGWKFIVLNSMYDRNQNRPFGDRQLEWLKTELRDDLPTLLFFHHPLETDHLRIWCKPGDLITERIEPQLFASIETYKKHIKGIFVGHGHKWIHDTLFESIRVYESESFGDESEPVAYVVGFNQKNLNIEVARDVLPAYE
jgi:Icc protein